MRRTASSYGGRSPTRGSRPRSASSSTFRAGRACSGSSDGELRIDASIFNEYLSDNLGEEFTAKDFRTWGGTLLAAVELERRGPAESKTAEARALAAAMRKVGDELGNTPAVARASYVSPAVVDRFREGRTLADFRNGSGPSRLTTSEVALVRLLRAS